jgi:hypothetical protein
MPGALRSSTFIRYHIPLQLIYPKFHLHRIVLDIQFPHFPLIFFSFSLFLYPLYNLPATPNNRNRVLAMFHIYTGSVSFLLTCLTCFHNYFVITARTPQFIIPVSFLGDLRDIITFGTIHRCSPLIRTLHPFIVEERLGTAGEL